MHTHILAFMEPRLFLVCGLAVLMVILIGYISVCQRGAFRRLSQYRSVPLDPKTLLYVLYDHKKPFSKDRPAEIENMVEELRATGSPPVSKEELDKALLIDPSLLSPFTSVVVTLNNKPTVLECQKKERELIGFAIIKKST